MFKKMSSSFMLFICNSVAFSLTVITEKIYDIILNKVFTALISQITNADVISKILITSKNVFTLTTKGYVVINYIMNDFKVSKNIEEFSERDKITLNKLKS